MVPKSLSGGVTTASNVDSAGDSFEAHAYKDSPAIAGEDGDESHIEWSVSPPPRAPLPLESLCVASHDPSLAFLLSPFYSSGEPCASDGNGEISHRRSVSPMFVLSLCLFLFCLIFFSVLHPRNLYLFWMIDFILTAFTWAPLNNTILHRQDLIGAYFQFLFYFYCQS